MNALIASTVTLQKVNTTTFNQHRVRVMGVIKAYLLTQTTEPLVASKQPFKVQLKAGKRYSWCACGHSKKQPFCDGTHKMLATKILPLRFVPDQDCTVWLCGCKHSGRAPYCDGTHKQDFIQKAELPTAPQS